MGSPVRLVEGVGADAAAAFERERVAGLADHPRLPRTPVVSAHRMETGRSMDPVWWLNGEGWTAVVKLMQDPGEDGLDWDAGARELAAHRSGLLANLPPGIRAPRCLGILRREANGAALWLEGIQGPTAAHWPFDWYRRAAVALARTQGVFAAGAPLPQATWLNQGSIADYAGEYPWADGAEPGDEAVLGALERLPLTLCHFDLHPRNMVVGDGEVVVLDWSSVGIGTLGEDASSFVASAILDGHVPVVRLRDLFAEVASGYAAGLRATGLVVDDSALGCALGALLAVRLGWVVARRLVGDQVDPGEREATQALQEFLRDLADRARRDPPRDVVRDGSRDAGDVRGTA